MPPPGHGRRPGGFQGDERGHFIAQRCGVHVGPVPGDHPAVLQPLQASLHGAAGDPEAPGGLEHAHPRLGGEQFDQVRVQAVHPPGETVVMVYKDIIIRSA